MSYEGILIGDRKHLGSGIMEYRLHMGPGYRVYYAIEGDKIIILLIGGDKDSQSSDIKRARSILKEWRKSNGIQKI